MQIKRYKMKQPSLEDQCVEVRDWLWVYIALALQLLEMIHLKISAIQNQTACRWKNILMFLKRNVGSPAVHSTLVMSPETKCADLMT